MDVIKRLAHDTKYRCAHMDCDKRASWLRITKVQGKTPAFYGYCERHKPLKGEQVDSVTPGTLPYRLYDNGGKTTDRYTLIFDGGVFTLSVNALSPRGVNSFCCTEEECYIDESDVRIELEDLPLQVYEAVMRRIVEED